MYLFKMPLFVALFVVMLLSGCSSSSDDGEKSSGVSVPLDEETTEEVISEDDTPSEGDYYIKLSEHLSINSEGTVALYVSSDINKSEKLIYNTAALKKITQALYENFDDAYDFIFLITNNKTRPSTVSYAGVFSKLKNDVEGIGAPLYDNTAQYHSEEGRLKGIMHFAYRSAIINGPTLHEIAHYWANKFRFDYDDGNGYRLGSGSHWGELSFYGGKGQLGGSYAPTLKAYNYTYEGKNNRSWILQSAEYYGWNANGGNSIGYNDVELYLMGLLEKSAVQDIIVPFPYGLSLPPDVINDPDFQDLIKDESGRRYFMAVETQRKPWSDILSEHSVPDRDPDFATSQKSFRVLTVLLDTEQPKRYEVDVVSTQIQRLALADDDHDAHNYNFWEATRGVGTLQVDGISETLKREGEKVYVSGKYTPEQIRFHGKSYESLRSKYTGRIWLDRNIGASRVCQTFDDTACFGDYFQWGRSFDGHEKKESEYNTTKAGSLEDPGASFVIVRLENDKDWLAADVDTDDTLRSSRWTSSAGASVCPVGYRVPTATELHDETDRNEFGDPFRDNTDAFEHFLKLPSAGYRNSESEHAMLAYYKTNTMLWTASVNAGKVPYLNAYSSGVLMYSSDNKAMGLNVRCIKEQ